MQTTAAPAVHRPGVEMEEAAKVSSEEMVAAKSEVIEANGHTEPLVKDEPLAKREPLVKNEPLLKNEPF